MIIALVILSCIVIAETAFIFWLSKVLKNTFEITQNTMDILMNKPPRNLQEAYDGKYYPATVFATIQFNANQEMTITDFSRYEDKKIVGFIIYTPKSMDEWYGYDLSELSDEAKEKLAQPAIFKNAIVFAPKEGMWTWKSSE